MAEYITKIKTADGKKPIDYNSLANLPDIDSIITTLNEHKKILESHTGFINKFNSAISGS